MKRFWIVLLSLGLIIAFGTTAFAVDAKFDGEFYLQGWYNKNASLIDKDEPTVVNQAGVGRGSSAFYTERLRMGINFQVAKGLRFYTAFDALERKWMAARKSVSTGSPGYGPTDQEAENIAWEVAYVQFFTPIGLFTIGNVPSSSNFGTPFSDTIGFSSGVMVWTLPKGPLTISATYKKSTDGYVNESMAGGTPIGAGTDNDSETYLIAATYRWKTGAVGGNIGSVFSRTANVPYPTIGPPFYTNTVSRKTDIPFMSLFVLNKFGKVYVEDEFGICPFGDYIKWNTPFTTRNPYYRNVEADMAYSNYFNINIDLSPAKIGFMFVISRGDDPETLDKKEGGFRSVLILDRSFNPCHILFNESYMQWFSPFGTGGATQGAGLIGNTGAPTAANPLANGISTYAQNVWMYQLYGDIDVTPKLNIGASFTYAYADEKPTNTGYPTSYAGTYKFVSDKYGSELDLTLKYKIFDNLEYMIGAAYFWTGDYFKGTNPDIKLDDNYLITHKLTLTF